MDNSISENKKTMAFFEGMLDYFEELNHLQAKVGVHSDAGEHNVKKALWNEFGTNHKLGFNAIAIQGQGLKPFNNNTYKYLDPDGSNLVAKGSDISIPARPFIRLYLYPELVNSLVKETVKDIEKKLFQKNIGRQDAKKTFTVIGKESLLLMRKKMYSRNYDKGSNNTLKDQEHNSPLTQYIKGKDMPLFDTAEMYNSMNYKSENRGI